IQRHADPASARRLFSLLRGKTRSLLELEDRPAAYDDVGRETRIDPDGLTRSAYERVFLQLAAGKPFRLAGESLVPVAVNGWYHAVLRDLRGEERVVSIDQLL